jgi:hypothetical protein
VELKEQLDWLAAILDRLTAAGPRRQRRWASFSDRHSRGRDRPRMAAFVSADQFQTCGNPSRVGGV